MKNRMMLLLGVALIFALTAFAGPADGNWSAASTAQGSPQALSLQATGTSLTGTADGAPISNGKVEGTTVWFTAVRSGVTYSYKGSISGSRLVLYETLQNGTGLRTLQFNHN